VKPAGKKKKGARLERKLASLIRQKGLDKDAKRMPLSGAFDHLKSDIYTRLPYSFECKNQERVKLWEWWAQAKEQAKLAEKPVLVISGNYRPILAVVEIDTLLDLLKVEQDYLDGT